MDEHLMRWMPVYTSSMEEDAETHLYRELARMDTRIRFLGQEIHRRDPVGGRRSGRADFSRHSKIRL